MKQRSRLSLLMIMILLLLSACESSRDIQLDLEYPDDQLAADKLVVWWDEGVPHDVFAVAAWEKRFADTTIEVIKYLPPPPQGLIPPNYMAPNLLEMMRDRQSPDLIVFDTRFLSLMIEAEYLDPIPDVYGLEIDYDIITEIRSIAPDLTLYALPFGRVAEGLFYNKTIFDEMQVPYPKDGMTWDEVLELAAALKRDQHSPIGITAYDSLASQLPLRWYDPETRRVDYDSKDWQGLLGLLLRMNDLEDMNTEERKSPMSSFSVGDTAMVAGPVYGGNGRPGLLNDEANLRLFDVDWDIVAFPIFDDGQGLQPASHMLGIGVPVRSQNKEDAYKVMRHLLSHEVQSDNSRKGLISLRSDAEAFQDEFGASSLLAGKSVSSFFSTSPRGVRDPVFEFIYFANSMLSAFVNFDKESVWDRDTFVELTQDNISKHIMKLYDERELIIEEIQNRF